MQHLLYKMTILVELQGDESVIKVALADSNRPASAADAATATE